MCQAGDAVKTSNDSSSKENKVEEVPCIVKFRPCKDWRGEYGFDWVREENDDFDETIEYDNKNSGFYFDFSFKEQEDFVRKKMGKDKDGSYKYDKLKRKKRREIRKAHVNDNPPCPADDFNAELEDFMYGLYDEYKTEAWASSDRKKYHYDDSAKKKAGALSPIEYFYGPKYIEKVSYRIDREKYGDVWFMEDLEYEDMANGSAEAEEDSYVNKPQVLKYFVAIDSSDNPIKQSLIYENGSFKVPLYYDKAFFFKMDSDTSKTVEFEKDGCYIKLEYYSKDGCDRLIAYVTKNSRMKFAADEMWFCYKDNKLVSYGWGKAPDRDQLPPSNSFDANDENEIKRKDENGFIKKYLTDNVVCNENINIASLLADEKVDKVRIVIIKPKARGSWELKSVKSKIFEVKKEEDNKWNKERWTWNGHRIFSWKEWHEYSFHIFPSDYERSTDRLTKIGLKGEKPITYCIPVLSFGIGNNRKRFEFRTSQDAPRKVNENKNEFNIQLFVKGSCKKIRLKSTPKNAIVTEPKGDLKPKDGCIKVKVKFNGKKACENAFITAYTVQKDENNKEVEIPVGKLQVKVSEPRELNAAFVKVFTGNKEVIGGEERFVPDPFSDSLSSCFEDQIDAIANAIGQTGITPVIRKDLTIEVENSALAPFKVNGNYVDHYDNNGNEGDLEDLFFNVFSNKYDKDPELLHSYPFFFIDGDHKDKSAYETEYYFDNNISFDGINSKKIYPNGKPVVVAFNYIANDRAKAYCMAHELLHALSLMHSFQLRGWKEPNVFCYPINKTSNIMDYYSLSYSLTKEQWEPAIAALDSYNSLVKQALSSKGKKKERRKKKR